VITLVALTNFVQAQTATEPAAAPVTQNTKDLSEVLGFMIGNWGGEGLSRGEHQFIGKMTVTSELEGNALLVRRESMNKEGGPSGGLQELMVIGFDGTNKKIVGTLYDNKNLIAIFVGESKDNEIVFTQAMVPEGYVQRRTFKMLPDGLSFVMEGATPGKEVSKLVEINFKKQ